MGSLWNGKIERNAEKIETKKGRKIRQENENARWKLRMQKSAFKVVNYNILAKQKSLKIQGNPGKS